MAKRRIHLTNKFTVLYFMQYGIDTIFEFNGDKSNAKIALKSVTGCIPYKEEETTRVGWLPAGYTSMRENIEVCQK